MATRQKKPKMAEQKQSSVGREDIFSGMEPQVTYSFAECQQIGKEFLEGLKQSVKGSTLLEIEEPCAKATNYLVKTEVLHLLEVNSFFSSDHDPFRLTYKMQGDSFQYH